MNGDIMKYKDIVNKNLPDQKKFNKYISAFLFGGVLGFIGNVLLEFYSYILHISKDDSAVFVITTLIFIACLLTCFGVFDKMVKKGRMGLIIPITGFAHSVQSAALDYKNEGLINGIGSNIFKLAGSVILYGVLSAYVMGIIRYLIGGAI